MRLPISTATERVAHGVAAAGREVSAVAQSAQQKVDGAVDAFEGSAVGDNAPGHFLGGLVEGTAQLVTGIVNIAGGILQLASADTRRDVAKTVADIARNPSGTVETISDVVSSAWREDKAHFFGEAASFLVPAAAARAATNANAAGATGTTAAAAESQAASAATSAARGGQAARPADTLGPSSGKGTPPPPAPVPAEATGSQATAGASTARSGPPADKASAPSSAEASGVTAVGAQTASQSLKTQPLRASYVGEEAGQWGAQVRYLNESERQAYRVTVRDGKLYDAQGKLFDSTSTLPFARPSDHQAMFVLGSDGGLYASTEQLVGQFHHSSFFAGRPVAGAGEMRVRQGVLKEIKPDESGHYKPGPELTRQVADFFQKGGVPLDDVPMSARRIPGDTFSDALKVSVGE